MASFCLTYDLFRPAPGRLTLAGWRPVSPFRCRILHTPDLFARRTCFELVRQKLNRLPEFYDFNRYTLSVTAWNPWRYYQKDWEAFRRDIKKETRSRGIMRSMKKNQKLTGLGDQCNFHSVKLWLKL